MATNRYQRHIRHDNTEFSLAIIRSKRKTLAIHVLPDSIEVRVPLKCPWVEIDGFINSRLDWLVSAREQMQSVPVPPKFLEGEVHEFRGELLALKVQAGGSNRIYITEKEILLYSREPSDEAYNEKIFYQFLRQESQKLFPDRLKHCVEVFPGEVKPAGLRTRRMRSRWGSCSESGEICLNTILMQKDVRALDLVITHELCHLHHFNHDAAFYALMDLAMPDWRSRETLLKTIDRPAGPESGQQLSLF